MLERICNDNVISIVIYLQSIKNYLHIISIILSIVLLTNYLFKIKKYYNSQILWKKTFRLLFLLVLIIIIPFSLNIIKNSLHISDICLENEEKESIDNNYIKPSQDIYLKEDLNEEERENHFYFLNVGAATESFIIEDQGHFGLIDASYASSAPYILRELELLGVEKLDFILITHSHLDHIGGFDKIMSSVDVNTLYIKVPGNVNSDYAEIYNHVINLAEDKKTTICDVKEDLCQNIKLGNIDIELYNTSFYTSNDILGLDRSRIENANCIVAVASINNRRIYFAADIGNYNNHNVEIELAEEIGDIDVYKVSHHGFTSYNNNSLALSRLKPEYGVITNTKTLSRNVVNLLKETNPNYQKTFYTTEGTVTLHVEPDGELIFNQ